MLYFGINGEADQPVTPLFQYRHRRYPYYVILALAFHKRLSFYIRLL